MNAYLTAISKVGLVLVTGFALNGFAQTTTVVRPTPIPRPVPPPVKPPATPAAPTVQPIQFTPALPAASSTNKAPAPKIFFPEPIHDFGQLSSGAVVKHEFKFTNQGDATLEITAVQPGCGCTMAGEWTKKAEPGQTGTIPIQFNSGNFGGPVSKGITVTCNDPAQQMVHLTFKATVWKPIEVTPNYAVFNVTAGVPTNETRSIRIVSNVTEPLTVSEPVCTNQAFKAQLKTIQPGKEFEVVISLVAIPTNATSIQTPITVKTSSTNMPTISISAFAMVQAPVAVSPSQVMLPAGPLATNLTRNVVIRNNHGTPLEITEPTVSVPGVETQIQPVQAGRYYNILLRFPTGFEIKPGQRVELSVKSNNPQYPVLKVPVYQPPRPTPQPVSNWQLRQPTPVVSPVVTPRVTPTVKPTVAPGVQPPVRPAVNPPVAAGVKPSVTPTVKPDNTK